MSTVAPRPPAPPINPALLDSEGYIDGHIHRTRRALKLVDFSAGVITLAVGLLAFLLVAGLIDHWVVPGGLGTAGRLTLFGLLLLGVCWYAWRQFVPLFRSINPVYAAHTIEKASPSLKNSLLNLLLFRGHRREMSAKVYHALEQQAAQRLSTASVDGAIDRTALLKLGYALVAVVAACALYAILSPKNLALSAGRVLAPWANLAAPSRVQILNIEPGDASVARGERIAVSAEVLSVREGESVRLRYSTLDEQQVDESITMSRPPGGARFAADLPRSADGGRAAGVMNDLEYWIEAGDARSPRFKLTVFDRPTIVVQRVHYQAPAYTGEPSRTVDNAGDIRGLEGTIVSIEALANQSIRSAYVDFDADGSSDLKMSVDDVRATASFELKLRPDRRTPLHTSYALRYTTTDGRTNSDPAQYRIEVSPDYAPEVRISKPEEREQSARVDETVLIDVEARDPDYAVAQVRLVGRIGENDVTVGDLLSRNHSGLFKGTKMFTPGDAGLKPGDVLEYWAEARDNRRPEANIALSEHRRLRIAAPDAAQQPQQNNERGGAGQPPPDQGQNGDEGQGGARGGAGEQGENQGADGQAGEDQGQGGAGGAGGQGEPQEGESPEAGDSASAGGKGGGQDGEQSAEPNGAGGQSGADGEDSEGSQEHGEQSAGGAAGDQSAEGGEHESGEQPSGGQQSGDPQAGANGARQQPGESGSAGEASEGGGEAGAQPGAQERVSPDGDDDSTAFDRIREHLQNQEAANRSQNGESAEGAEPDGAEQGGADQQQGAAGDQQQQGTAGDQTQNPPAGQQQGGAAPERAGAANQDQQDEQAQNPSAGELADGQPGEGQAPTAGEGGQQTQGASANSDATGANAPNQGEGETPAGADGALNQNNGESPAGDESAGQPGAPEASNKRDREGTDERDDGESANEGEPATADARGDSESDARGDQGGDRAGGGQRGGGQQAENAGQGEAGSHTASDTGAGQSSDQGAGETGTEGGQQQLASGETGESSGDQAGAGSETGDAEGEQQSPTGGEQAGDPAGGEEQGSAGGQPGDAATKQSDPGAEASNDPAAGKPQPGEGSAASGRPGEPSPNSEQSADPSSDPSDEQSEAPGDQSASGSSGSQSGQPSPSDPAAQDDAQPKGDAPGGSSGAPPVSGGASGGGVDGTSTGTDPGGDDPNLLYAREQTDLVLQRLDEQLAKQKVDAELLKRLGWNEDELRQFVTRWKGLAARAEGEGADAADAKQQLNTALRTLGLRRDGPQRIRAAAATDQIRDLKDGFRAKAPLEYMDRVRLYMKGASAADDK